MRRICCLLDNYYNTRSRYVTYALQQFSYWVVIIFFVHFVVVFARCCDTVIANTFSDHPDFAGFDPELLSCSSVEEI